MTPSLVMTVSPSGATPGGGVGSVPTAIRMLSAVTARQASPDCTKIAYNDNRLKLWVIDVASGKNTRADAHTMSDGAAAFDEPANHGVENRGQEDTKEGDA